MAFPTTLVVLNTSAEVATDEAAAASEEATVSTSAFAVQAFANTTARVELAGGGHNQKIQRFIDFPLYCK